MRTRRLVLAYNATDSLRLRCNILLAAGAYVNVKCAILDLMVHGREPTLSEMLVPAVIISGTYRPTNGGAFDGTPPAPAAPYGAALAIFNGTVPNGTWNLFVFDDLIGDSGSIAGGWSLDITTNGPIVSSFTPTSGPAGTQVVITGSNLTAATGDVRRHCGHRLHGQLRDADHREGPGGRRYRPALGDERRRYGHEHRAVHRSARPRCVSRRHSEPGHGKTHGRRRLRKGRRGRAGPPAAPWAESLAYGGQGPHDCQGALRVRRQIRLRPLSGLGAQDHPGVR